MVTETIETGSLRVRALAAYRLQQEAEAAAERDRDRREAERQEEARRRQLERFQAALDARGFAGVVADSHFVDVEGATLAVRCLRDGDVLIAVARCADCREPDTEAYTFVRTLADFGAVLVNWLPQQAEHRCRRCENVRWDAEERARQAAWAEREAARTATPADDGGLDLPPRCVEARLGDLLRELIDARLAARP